MIFDGAITGVQDPQCKTCANADICKFTGMSEDLEKQLSDIADLASTPFTITLECKYRRLNTYANTRALNPKSGTGRGSVEGCAGYE